jgi:hypothetical protein
VTTLVLTAFALGLAGLDPAGALVVAGALAAGAREGHVALFGLVVLVGTVVLGTTLSLTVGPRIAEIDWSVFAPGDRTVAFVETLLGVGLVCWGVVRARRPTAHAPKPRSARGTGPIALVGAGILFALSAVLDPTFVALTVIAGRDGSFWSAAVAHSVWVLVSQGPLVLVLGAMAGGKHKGVVIWFRSLWSRLRPAIGRLVTGAVLFVGAFFLLDAGWWFVTGELLVPN